MWLITALGTRSFTQESCARDCMALASAAACSAAVLLHAGY